MALQLFDHLDGVTSTGAWNDRGTYGSDWTWGIGHTYAYTLDSPGTGVTRTTAIAGLVPGTRYRLWYGVPGLQSALGSIMDPAATIKVLDANDVQIGSDYTVNLRSTTAYHACLRWLEITGGAGAGLDPAANTPGLTTLKVKIIGRTGTSVRLAHCGILCGIDGVDSFPSGGALYKANNTSTVWSNGTHWTNQQTGATGVVPGDGDDVLIDQNVTVNAGSPVTLGSQAKHSRYSCLGFSSTTARTLTLNDSLTLKGGWKIPTSGGGTVTVAAGKGIETQPPTGIAYRVVHLNGAAQLTLNGTNAARCFYRTQAGATPGQYSFAATGGVGAFGLTANYTDFARLGGGLASSLWSFYLMTRDSPAANVSLSNCTLDAVGCLAIDTQTNASGASASVQLTDCRWTSSFETELLLKSAVTTAPAGARSITRCAFSSNMVQAGTPASSSLNYYALQDVAVKGSPGLGYSTRKWAGCTGLFVGDANVDNGMKVLGGVNYLYMTRTNALNNWHGSAVGNELAPVGDFTIGNAVVEALGTQGGAPDPFLVGLVAGDCVVTLANCLLLPDASGNGTASIVTGNGSKQGGAGNPKLRIEHCTWCSTAQFGDAFMGESAGGGMGAGFLQSLRSNIAWSNVASSAYLCNLDSDTPALNDFVGTGTGDQGVDCNCTFNGGPGGVYVGGVFNNSAAYTGYGDPAGNAKSLRKTNPFAARDLHLTGADAATSGPMFVDPTRDLASWAVCKGAANAGDSNATKWAAAWSLLAADPTRTRTDLIPWVQAGFAPRNPALATAAHDGTTIGAVPFVSVVSASAAPLIIMTGGRSA